MRRIALALAMTLAIVACGGTTDTPSPAPVATQAPTPPAAGTQAATSAVATTEAPTTATPTTTMPSVAEGFPVTVSHATGAVTLADRPTSIVSISPTATEILFALGAGHQVLAVDSLSNYPADAPITDLSAFEANVEAIAGFEPDLVVMSYDPGDVESGLTALGIPVIMQFSALSLGDAYDQIRALGAATGHIDAAAELVEDMQDTLSELNSELAGRAVPLTYYHELDSSLYSVTSSTFIGELYSVIGLENIADPADEAGYGFPQLSAEYLLQADPDFIFLADTKCCAQDATTAAARPGWSKLTAVKEGRVIELDDDVASRWGPRIIEFLEIIVEAIEKFDAHATD